MFAAVLLLISLAKIESSSRLHNGRNEDDKRSRVLVDRESIGADQLESLFSILRAFIQAIFDFLLLKKEEAAQEEALSLAPTSASPLLESDASSSVPSIVASTVPVDVPSMVPSIVQDLALSDSPSTVASDAPSTVPSDVPSTLPSDVPSMVPSDAPSMVPSDVPSMVPSDLPSMVPSDLPSTVPSDVPSTVPSEVQLLALSDAPSNNPSDLPSMGPSDVPSLMPSDFPSTKPSDLPSILPSLTPILADSSDVPSLSPSDFPSSIPSKSPNKSDDLRSIDDDTIPNDVSGPQEGYDTCPTSETIKYEELSEMTVLYGYRFTVREGVRESFVTRQIEQALQTMLIDEVCVDSTGAGALAISPEPDDIPSAFCEGDNMPSGNSTCHTVAVRTKLMLATELTSEMAELYCKTIEKMREYIASGELIGLIDGLETIQEFNGADIIPDFCSLVVEVTNEDESNVTTTGATVDTDSSNTSESKSSKRMVGPAIGISGAAGVAVGMAVLYIYFGAKRRSRQDELLEVPSEAV